MWQRGGRGERKSWNTGFRSCPTFRCGSSSRSPRSPPCSGYGTGSEGRAGSRSPLRSSPASSWSPSTRRSGSSSTSRRPRRCWCCSSSCRTACSASPRRSVARAWPSAPSPLALDRGDRHLHVPAAGLRGRRAHRRPSRALARLPDFVPGPVHLPLGLRRCPALHGGRRRTADRGVPHAAAGGGGGGPAGAGRRGRARAARDDHAVGLRGGDGGERGPVPRRPGLPLLRAGGAEPPRGRGVPPGGGRAGLGRRLAGRGQPVVAARLRTGRRLEGGPPHE